MENESSLFREGRSAGLTPVGTRSVHSETSCSAAMAYRAYTSKRAPGTLDVPVVRAAQAASLSTKRMTLFPVSCSRSWKTEATIANSSKMKIVLVEAAKAHSSSPEDPFKRIGRASVEGGANAS